MIRLYPIIALSSTVFLLSACSSTFKARQEQREKMASAAGLYCEFIDGAQHPDTDVELNMAMARRCDSNRNYTITNYKNSSDRIGVMYCCTMMGHEPRVVRRERMSTPAPAPAPVSVAPAKEKESSAPAKSTDDSADDVVAE